MENLVQNILVALIVGAAACYAGRAYLPKRLRTRLFGQARESAGCASGCSSCKSGNGGNGGNGGCDEPAPPQSGTRRVIKLHRQS